MKSLLCLLIFLIVACTSDASDVATEERSVQSHDNSDYFFEETRKYDGVSATVRLQLKRDAFDRDAQYRKLVGAIAWLKIGWFFQEKNTNISAIESALSGIHELGDVYNKPISWSLHDDTGLLLPLAKEKYDKGEEVSAPPFLSVLNSRIWMFGKRFKMKLPRFKHGEIVKEEKVDVSPTTLKFELQEKIK